MQPENSNTISRRTLLKGLSMVLATVGVPSWLASSLAGCAGKPTATAQTLLALDTTLPLDEAVHLLNRTSYGVTLNSLAALKEIGVDAWIEQQLDPETLDDSGLEQRLSALSSLNLSGSELLLLKPSQVISELEQATLLRAIYSQCQLQEMRVDF